MAAYVLWVSYFYNPNASLVSIICKYLNLYSKTCEDFLSAPESFKFEDRNWNLELGWERYDHSMPAKKVSSSIGNNDSHHKSKSEMTINERDTKLKKEMKNGQYVLKINSKRTDHLPRFVVVEPTHDVMRSTMKPDMQGDRIK